jgi:hypothetical protein
VNDCLKPTEDKHSGAHNRFSRAEQERESQICRAHPAAEQCRVAQNRSAVSVQIRQPLDPLPALASIYLLDLDLIEVSVEHGSTLLG